jgi:enterochelin esterase family protein
MKQVPCTIQCLRLATTPRPNTTKPGIDLWRPALFTLGMLSAGCSNPAHAVGSSGASGSQTEAPSGTSPARAGSGSGTGASPENSGTTEPPPSSGTLGSSGTVENVAGDATAGDGQGGVLPEAGTGDTAMSVETDAPGVTLTDPGTDGDGDYTIGPNYASDPLNNSTAGVPVGHQILFQMPPSTQSAFYTGLSGPFTRNILVYVPQQYTAGTPAPFLVVQDGVPRGQNGANGIGQVWLGRWDAAPPTTMSPNLPATANVPNILDNLIATKMVPTLVAIFVDSGPGDYIGSERGLEYDTVSGKFGTSWKRKSCPSSWPRSKPSSASSFN